jgi:hypothetical protein
MQVPEQAKANDEQQLSHSGPAPAQISVMHER